MLHEQTVVVGDDATLTVEHGREHAALNAAATQKICFLLTHLFQTFGAVPGFQLTLQVILNGTCHKPPNLCGSHDVTLVGIEFLLHLNRVTAHLNAEADSQLFGKLLCQQVLSTKVAAVIIVEVLRTGQGKQNHLAAALDFLKVKVVVDVHGVHDLAPGRHHLALRLLLTASDQ